MPTRRSQRRSKPTHSLKRGKPQSKISKKKRSAAAKKGWVKRRKRDKLLAAMRDKGWEPVDLGEPTKSELYDYMEYIAHKMEIDISDAYRMYRGYPMKGE